MTLKGDNFTRKAKHLSGDVILEVQLWFILTSSADKPSRKTRSLYVLSSMM